MSQSDILKSKGLIKTRKLSKTLDILFASERRSICNFEGSKEESQYFFSTSLWKNFVIHFFIRKILWFKSLDVGSQFFSIFLNAILSCKHRLAEVNEDVWMVGFPYQLFKVEQTQNLAKKKLFQLWFFWQINSYLKVLPWLVQKS